MITIACDFGRIAIRPESDDMIAGDIVGAYSNTPGTRCVATAAVFGTDGVVGDFGRIAIRPYRETDIADGVVGGFGGCFWAYCDTPLRAGVGRR